jgi:hypothetical protein
MALRRFSDNPAATLPLDGAETIPALQAGVDVQVTVSDIVDAASGAVTSVNGATGAVVLALDDLDDVDAAAPSDGDVLTWNDTAGAWEPAAGGGGSGIVESIVAGTGINVDDTDPANPVVSATGSGSGDVVGPGSSVDNTLPRFDGTGGKTLQGSGVAVTDNNEISGYRGHLNAQTGTTYTLQASDSGKIVECTNGSAITVTLPNSLGVGFCCTIVQGGAGAVTLSPASGATRRNRQSHTKTAGQWAGVTLYVRTNSGGSAAEYVMCGDTAA